MLIFRIIFVIAILFGIFLLPWWVIGLMLLIAVVLFNDFYESVALALISDLFYSHNFFSINIFIPVGAVTVLILVLISSRIRSFVI